MTIRVSSKFKELILGPSSFESIFNGGRIVVFSGAQPASADDGFNGTPLADVTVNGSAWVPNGSAAGLNFARDGVWATKDPSQFWRLTATVAGTAGWFRLFSKVLDNGGLGFETARLDGTVGTTLASDFRLPTTTLTVGYTIPVQQFLFSFPPILGA